MVVPSSSSRHEGSILSEDLSCVGVSSQPSDDIGVLTRVLTHFLIEFKFNCNKLSGRVSV